MKVASWYIIVYHIENLIWYKTAMYIILLQTFSIMYWDDVKNGDCTI